MDWGSTTTKKHIKEAEAQGYKLIGPGKDRLYRLYEGPCGHVREIMLANMRKGTVGCPICLQEKLQSEAKAQGCELLGRGDKKNYYRYKLPCGHEQELRLDHVRDANFRCSACMAEKLDCEAEAQSCKLLGPGKSKDYRLYRLSCGHELQVNTARMRTGEFECKTCIGIRIRQEADAQNCTILGPGRNRHCLLYLLPCGHEKEVNIISMREGEFRCKVCLDARLRAEAADQNCELLGPGKHFKSRLYRLPCGHEQEIATGHMRSANFKCGACIAEKLEQEARVYGCELLGSGKSVYYRLYRLPCGHERELQTGNMRIGNFRCQECEETSRTQPSNLYLLHIKVDNDELLKLGYAKIVASRALSYGLPTGAEITPIKSIPFETGNKAHEMEANLHSRYRRKRLPPKQMKRLHTDSGFKECYPVTMLDTLLAELEDLEPEAH